MGHCYKRRKIRKTIPYCTLFGPFLVQTSRSRRETKVLRELSFFIDVLILFYSAAICSYSISTVSGGVLIFFFNPWFSKLSLHLWLQPKLISYLYFESDLTAWFRTTHKFSNFLEHISLLQKVPRCYIYILLECLLSERTHSHLITLKSKEKVRKLTGG